MNLGLYQRYRTAIYKFVGFYVKIKKDRILEQALDTYHNVR